MCACRIANKMNLYMDTFARFKTRGQIDELEAIFKHYADVLAEFERVQLGMCCSAGGLEKNADRPNSYTDSWGLGRGEKSYSIVGG